jgi:hypothetical protein
MLESFNRQAEAANWPIRCNPSLAFLAPELRSALEVWRAKAGTRRWPSRAAMTPRAMKAFLTDLSILDVEYLQSGLRFRARLTGTDLARTFGSASGKYLDEVVPAPFLERWQAMLKLALEVGGPVRTMSKVEFRAQDFLMVEAFYAPLGEANLPPDAILVVARADANWIGKERIIAGPASVSAL